MCQLIVSESWSTNAVMRIPVVVENKGGKRASRRHSILSITDIELSSTPSPYA